MTHKYFSNKILLLILISSALFVQHAYAAVQITEIMYDVPGTDTNREWIEIYNPDSTSVDITKLKFFEANTNHSITALGASTLDPQSYAIIADKPDSFKADWPSYTGLLYDSTFSLTNTGETLVIKAADGSTLDTVTYDPLLGAGGDEGSLQKINGVWAASVPTPGIENVLNPIATSTDNTNTATTTATSTMNTTTSQSTQSISVHASPIELSSYQEDSLFQLSAGRSRVAYVNAPLDFTAHYKLSSSISGGNCTFHWSYGDGLEEIGEKVSHIYKYPGEYSVVVNGTCSATTAVARTNVRVLVPQVSILTLQNGDITIINTGDTEINLGLWKLKSDSHVFVFPQDTIVSTKNTITLASEDTNMGTSSFIALDNQIDKEIFTTSTTSLYQVTSNTVLPNNTNISATSTENGGVSIQEHQKPLTLKQPKIQPIKVPSGEVIHTTATVLDATNPPSDSGFWHTLWNAPKYTLKRILNPFYSF